MTDTPEQLQATVDKRVDQYIQVRNALKKIDEEYDAKRKPLVEIQNMLSGWMQAFLEKTGSESVKTKSGTCYQSTRYTASLADPEAFMKFVIDNHMFDLLDRKANATACRDYAVEHKNLPPGVNMSAVKTVGVRSPRT
jgi:EAL domain-containing protein (putative c-di-GMP-specific phosphodiesterase class I)